MVKKAQQKTTSDAPSPAAKAKRKPPAAKAKRKPPAAFEKNKGKIMDFTTKETLAAGGRAAAQARKRNNAMRDALMSIMEMKAAPERAAYLRSKFPDLKDVQIDGYVEAAAQMRQFASRDYRATAKLIEMMGGSEAEKETQNQKLTIVVASAADAKLLDDI